MSMTVWVKGPTEAKLYDSKQPGLALSALQFKQTLNSAGSATIGFPFNHDLRSQLSSLIIPYRSVIEIYVPGSLRFRGRALQLSEDFNHTLTVLCEGEFNFFCDSVITARTLTGTPAAMFAELINEHNSQVDDFKQFTLGSVNINVSPGPIEFKDPVTTAAAVKKLIEKCGGILHFSTSGTNRVISWSISRSDNIQKIKYGKNLLDIKTEFANNDLCTRIFAYGKEIDGARIALPSPGYVEDATAQATYGIIAEAKVFNDCATQSALSAAAIEYLNKHKALVSSLSAKAVDLSASSPNMIDPELGLVAPWEVGRWVQVQSAPHNVSGAWLLTQYEGDLLNMQNVTLTLGTMPTPISEIVNH